jgi:anti-sigma factor RsiW
MKYKNSRHSDSHPSDSQLALEVEGELSAPDEKRVRAHLAECWECRARRQGIEDAMTGFVRSYQREFEMKMPPAEGPRAVLKARLAQMAAKENHGWPAFPLRVAWAVALCGLLALGLMVRSMVDGVCRRGMG